MKRTLSCLLTVLLFITTGTYNVLADDDEEIQILINNLPNDEIIIENNLDDIKNKIIQIDNIKNTLSEEELKLINFSKYNNAINIINNLNINTNIINNNIVIDIPVDETTFPDKHFRAYIIGRFGDSLSKEEIKSATKIDFNDVSTASLKGIEYFANLEELKCDDFLCLKSLDVSKNTKLKYLNCNFCGLSSIDLSKNTELIKLDIANNALTSLDVNNNTKLEELICHSNKLTSLNLSKNVALKKLECEWNQLTSLDISNNVNLTEMYCDNNKFSILINENNEFDLSSLPGFDLNKASNWNGGVIDSDTNILKVNDGVRKVTYKYDCGNNMSCDFMFNVNNGYAVNFYDENDNLLTTQLVTANSKAIIPVDLNKAGYNLECYTNKEYSEKYNFNNRVTNTTNIYVKYYPKSYTVNYDYDNGDESLIKIDVKWDDVVLKDIVSPSKDGYTFRYWLYENKKVTSSMLYSELVDNNDETNRITIKAIYEKNKEETPILSKAITCEEYMKSKDWTWSESKKACVYKVSDTKSE